MDEYSLFVEGGILSQLKENAPIGPEVSGDSEDAQYVIGIVNITNLISIY